MQKHDPALDTLLDLDGLTLVVDPEGGHWVKFVVTRVPATAEKPHGLDYSLTLHERSGERLLDSTMLIPWPSNSGAARRTIATASGR